MRDYLGIGFGSEQHPLRLQLLPQAAVVLDDAVLHHRQTARAIEVGVGVALLRLAVGSPAGMADAALARGPLGLKAGREIYKLALCLEAMEASPVNGGNAGGVVAAIFQLAQTLQQLGSRLPRSNQGNNAAHRPGPARSATKKPGEGPGLSLLATAPMIFSRTSPSSDWFRRPSKREC